MYTRTDVAAQDTDCASDDKAGHASPIWINDDDADDAGQQSASVIAVDESEGEEGEREADDDEVVYVGQERPAFVPCKECGSKVFSFSAAAHAAFHKTEHKSRKRKAS